MTVLLTDTQESLWWGAVIVGFVVVLAVAALLRSWCVLVRSGSTTGLPRSAPRYAAERNTATHRR